MSLHRDERANFRTNECPPLSLSRSSESVTKQGKKMRKKDSDGEGMRGKGRSIEETRKNTPIRGVGVVAVLKLLTLEIITHEKLEQIQESI